MIIERIYRPEDDEVDPRENRVLENWIDNGLDYQLDSHPGSYDYIYERRRPRKIVTSKLQSRVVAAFGHCIEGDHCRVPEYNMIPDDYYRETPEAEFCYAVLVKRWDRRNRAYSETDISTDIKSFNARFK